MTTSLYPLSKVPYLMASIKHKLPSDKISAVAGSQDHTTTYHFVVVLDGGQSVSHSEDCDIAFQPLANGYLDLDSTCGI